MLTCTSHGGPTHIKSDRCPICAIEKQTKELTEAIIKSSDNQVSSMAAQAMLNPFCWHEIKTDDDGNVYVRMIADSEIYIKPPKKSFLEVMRGFWK